MKNLAPALSIALALLTAHPLAAQEISTSAGVTRLSDAEVREALDALKTHFLHRSELTPEKLNRASLQGLVEQLGPGAIFKAANATAAAEAPFRSETLGSAGYARLGTLNNANFAALDAALNSWGTASVKSLILDFRATPLAGEYDLAADFLGRFCGKGRELFSLKSGDNAVRVFTGNRDPSFRGLLVVLVDGESGGASEVIAAVLRQQVQAMVIGTTTSGRAVEYAPVNFKTSGSLQIAVAEAVLPEIGSLFPQGVKPDIAAGMSTEMKRAVLAAELQQGVRPSITSPDVARMNEASLVSGGTPEIDAMEAQQRNPNGRKAAMQDTVLQRAMDVIASIGVLQRAGK